MTSRPRHLDLKQPSPYIEQLLAALTGEEDFHNWPKGSRFLFLRANEPMCYFVRKGTVMLARNDDALALGVFLAPLAIGFTHPLTAQLHLRAMEECELAMLPYAQTMERVQEKGIWDIVARHVMCVTNKLFIYNEMLTAPTNYDILRYQLLMLMQEPDSVRSGIAAYQYILDRTRLSRSSVMKMLSALKEGGYIQLKNGKLTAINHLPDRF